jgi:hypothetical protein
MKPWTVSFCGALVLLVLTGVTAMLAQGPTTMTVVRDPGCGCCLNWVDHLEKAGIKATVSESADMDAIKDQRGVPAAARSCHTGVIGGYVIEGHVPAGDIKRLLMEHPADVAGLAVPGMPAGSPGMEVPGGRIQPYDVMAFDKAGKTRVFASHR